MQKKELLLKNLSLVWDVLDFWLHSSQSPIEDAILKTKEDGRFSRDDIDFAIQHYRESISYESLHKWLNNSFSASKDINSRLLTKKVLCLHAGNLPLVGLQDVLAVMLSGNHYFGKVSVKDPWLLPSLIGLLEDKAEISCEHSTEIRDFEGLNADAILFSGSGESVITLTKLLGELQITSPQTKSLIRTAHASVAWISAADLEKNETIESIVWACFRHNGKGCRSLAAIFTDADEDMVVQMLSDKASAMQLENRILSVTAEVKFSYSYHKSVGRKAVLIADTLFVCGEPDIWKNKQVTITRSKPQDLHNFLESAGSAIQSVYSVDGTDIPFLYANTESLHMAQTPPISWKPDGTDPLLWLLNTEHNLPDEV
ncbi:MAG: acyl-CoA reductase [Balneolales bacterium]|nr:acyl-CoA reductase [Balneolales bacterium]